MIYQISSDNLSLTPSMETLGREKTQKLEKFFPNLPPDEVKARIVLNKGSREGMFEVKFELSVRGKRYFSQEKNFSLETAVINCVDEIERQLEKSRNENERDWEKLRDLKVWQD